MTYVYGRWTRFGNDRNDNTRVNFFFFWLSRELITVKNYIILYKIFDKTIETRISRSFLLLLFFYPQTVYYDYFIICFTSICTNINKPCIFILHKEIARRSAFFNGFWPEFNTCVGGGNIQDTTFRVFGTRTLTFSGSADRVVDKRSSLILI